MFSYPTTASSPSFATVLASFADSDGMPFSDALTEEDIQLACRRHNVCFAAGSNGVWTPALTLWTFLGQCLASSKSCVAAVSQALILRVAMGLPLASA